MKKLILFFILTILTFSVDEEKVNNIINNSLNNITNSVTQEVEENKVENENKQEEISIENITNEELKKIEENLDISNPTKIYNLSRIYAKLGMFESAYRVAMLDSTKDVRNLYVAATSARQYGNYNKSVELYNQILKKDPTHLKSVLGIGLAYRGLGEYKRAISYLENYNEQNRSEAVSILIEELMQK